MMQATLAQNCTHTQQGSSENESDRAMDGANTWARLFIIWYLNTAGVCREIGVDFEGGRSIGV